jgi:predicted nucleotidyltransferase
VTDRLSDVLGMTSMLREAAVRVASRLSLPSDWLNDAAKGYAHGMAPGETLLEKGALVVRTLAIPQLLAMKLSAWRDDLDIDDAKLLLSKLPGGKDEIWRDVEPYVVPGRQLKASYAFADLWEAQHGHP